MKKTIKKSLNTIKAKTIQQEQMKKVKGGFVIDDILPG